MALASHIIYREADGEIRATFWYAAGWTPSAEQLDGYPGCAHLEAPFQDPLPQASTHKVDLSGTPALSAKSQATQDAEASSLRRTQIELMVAELDNKRAALAARNFDTSTVDQQITALMAEYATL